MRREEVALQLTLKAMDNMNTIGINIKREDHSEEAFKQVQQFNAKQVYEFYNTVLENLKKCEE